MREILISFLSLFFAGTSFAQDQLKDFRSTNQQAVFLGFFNEFVEPSIEDSLAKELRKEINRYTRSYQSNAISSFKLLSNPNNIYVKPVESEIDEAQQEYLVRTAEDNRIDIFVLGLIRESLDAVEMELQLFDARIRTLSSIERQNIELSNRQNSLQELVHRTMNYLDRDGFVHPSPQDFLEKPVFLKNQSASSGLVFQSASDSLTISPEDLSGSPLAGRVSIGGEKTPFWEKWWFWTAIFGSVAATTAVSYYFFVVDRPPSRAKVTFEFAPN